MQMKEIDKGYRGVARVIVTYETMFQKKFGSAVMLTAQDWIAADELDKKLYQIYVEALEKAIKEFFSGEHKNYSLQKLNKSAKGRKTWKIGQDVL